MYYSYPGRYSYLYGLPYNLLKIDVQDYKYLSIKKVGKHINFTIGETIFLYYRNNKYAPPSIIGFCKIAGEITKVSDIPKEEREFCFNRTYLQLPVNDIHCR